VQHRPPPPEPAIKTQSEVRDDAAERSPRALSIEHRLPLLICALLLVVVVAFVWLAHREVQRSALAVARERLVSATRFLAQNADLSTGRIVSTLRAAASPDSAVAAYLRSPGEATEPDARATLRRLIGRANAVDPTVIELWSADRRRLLSTAPSPGLSETEREDAFLQAATDSAAVGPLRVLGNDVYTSTIAPVLVDGERRGYLVRWARIGEQPDAAKAVSEIIGQNAVIYYANPAGGVVLNVTGEPVRFPLRVADVDTTLEYEREGAGGFVAASVPLRSSNWVLITEFPRATILARSMVLLRRLAGLAVVLVLAGGAGAWLLSRGITRPLSRLTHAAESITVGDYSARVDTGRADELGRLAATFNTMGTNLGDAQRRLEDARASAEQANAAKSQFLAVMSHEIRTPLNAILGYTDLLQLGVGGALTQTQLEYLGRTQASGKHLLSLISDILDLSKIEAGSMEVHRETARASVGVEAALALVAPQAAARDVTIVNQCDASAEIRYVGDEGRVQQILANLLSNAVKFTDPGGRVTVQCSAVLSSSNAPAWTVMRVSDTGIGIARDRLSSIWHPFVQGDMGHTRAYGGTGLGLTISRQLALLMDGDLTVESEPHVGSTFTLWLPAATPSAPRPSMAREVAARS
jgi:signal transduction histidine kinase